MGSKPKPAARRKSSATLKPPPGGAIVRMYRIGHGDCFLIAFAGKKPDTPSFVLIDCGYKPGSPDKLATPTTVKAIAADILAATGGFVDVAIVTHEHQDHVNGLTPDNFPGLKVGEVWFAWTESSKDDVANALRKKFNDRLLGLVDARVSLLGLNETDAAERLSLYLEAELGEDAVDFNGRLHLAAAGKDPAKSVNKRAMKFLRACAPGDPEFLYPHKAATPVPGAASARVFVLGPPRDIDKIDDLDPIGGENFGGDDDHHAAMPGQMPGIQAKASPFSRRHAVPLEEAVGLGRHSDFFRARYGSAAVAVADAPDGEEVPANAPWRRIDADEAADAASLALAMNNATNNSSLVLAFELSKGGKVLLFAGDAQAGNWRSWSDASFDDDGTMLSAKALLGRTVLYKVGHHGSHNATLNGNLHSETPNLAWMAQGKSADEFTAMVTAVEAWARQKPKPDWNHPLPAIKDALLAKAGGRVLQTDTGLDKIKPVGLGASGWGAFLKRVVETQLYFDLTIGGEQ